MTFTLNAPLSPDMLPDRICVFDTETSDVDVESARIVTAFVGVMDDAGNMLERYSWLLDVTSVGAQISEAASAVHGITNDRAATEGTNPSVGVVEIADLLRALAEEMPLVAMNAAFDFTILDRELARYWPGLALMVPNEEGLILSPVVFDPMVLDRAWDKYRKGSRKLVDLARVYGVPVEENAHDAEADCRMAGRVALKLMADPRLHGMTLAQVHRKTIATHRANAQSLADYWERNLHTVADEDYEARLAAIADVRQNAGLWPMRPRVSGT